VERFETVEKFGMAGMSGRFEKVAMLGELLSIYNDSGCYDWPMDATLGDLLEWQLAQGLCLRAGLRAPLRTADLARRAGAGGGPRERL
jgi:hypothetical protein